jgi:hypothetical protein
MKKESTMFLNYKLIVDEFDIPVALEVNDEIRFKLYDHVYVNDDGGYIGPGLNKPGIGRIVEIRRDNTDYHFGVLMASGEFGYTKDSRLRRLEE